VGERGKTSEKKIKPTPQNTLTKDKIGKVTAPSLSLYPGHCLRYLGVSAECTFCDDKFSLAKVVHRKV